MNVSKIETVDVEQGLGGRIWGYGTLLIRGTGSGFEPLVGVGVAAGDPQRDRGGLIAPHFPVDHSSRHLSVG